MSDTRLQERSRVCANCPHERCGSCPCICSPGEHDKPCASRLDSPRPLPKEGESESRGDERSRVPAEATVYTTEVFDGYPELYVYVCPYCRKQYRGPGGHHMAGDDAATSCFHRRPGERGVTQPRLIRVRVEPAEPFIPLPIPADRPLGRTLTGGGDVYDELAIEDRS